MRRTPFAALALAFALAAGSAEAQTLKIAYINSQEILNTYDAAKQAQDQYNKDVESYQAEAQQLRDELDRMQSSLQQQELTLSKEAKANRQQQIQQKAQAAQQRMQELDQQAQQRRQQLIQPVMDKVNAVIDTVRKEGNYAFILDAAAGSILAADPSLDLTQEVIRRLKAQADTTKGPKGPPAPKPKGPGGR